MDNNDGLCICGDFLNDLKNHIEAMKEKYSTEQEKLEIKVLEISRLEKTIEQTTHELIEYKSKTKEILEEWKERELEIDKLKLMQEKASVILECNRKKHELESKTMETIMRNHKNLTTCAFKNVIQETGRMIINSEINSLTDRKEKLDDKLRRLQETKTENQHNLAEARKELMEIRARGETVGRLRRKLEESEISRLNAIVKLKNLKTLNYT